MVEASVELVAGASEVVVDSELVGVVSVTDEVSDVGSEVVLAETSLLVDSDSMLLVASEVADSVGAAVVEVSETVEVLSALLAASVLVVSTVFEADVSVVMSDDVLPETSVADASMDIGQCAVWQRIVQDTSPVVLASDVAVADSELAVVSSETVAEDESAVVLSVVDVV